MVTECLIVLQGCCCRVQQKVLTFLRCDIPVVLVKITKLNSRRLKVKTQLYFLYIY